jgi:hypothetical protein
MNISLLRNSALVHTHTVRRQGKILMRKFISSFGGFSVKAFTNRDIVGLRIWLTPPLPDPPYRHLAPRSFASSGKGRCNAFASFHGARHPDVAFLLRRQDDRHGLRVDWLGCGVLRVTIWRPRGRGMGSLNGARDQDI